jgi:hypothetical protein
MALPFYGAQCALYMARCDKGDPTGRPYPKFTKIALIGVKNGQKLGYHKGIWLILL